MLTLSKINSSLSKCFSEVSFNSMRGQISVPNTNAVMDYYQVLLAYPYYMEFKVGGMQDKIQVSIKAGFVPVVSGQYLTTEEFDKVTYKQAVDALSIMFHKLLFEYPKEFNPFDMNNKALKEKLAEALKHIVTKERFDDIEKTAAYFDPVEYAPQHMYSVYKLRYPNRNTEYHISLIYHKAGETGQIPYPEARIQMEIEEDEGRLDYNEFIEHTVDAILEDIEREHWHVYFILNMLDTALKDSVLAGKSNEVYGASESFEDIDNTNTLDKLGEAARRTRELAMKSKF